MRNQQQPGGKRSGSAHFAFGRSKPAGPGPSAQASELTFVELLVVISTSALVAGLIAVAPGRARQPARSCLAFNNLRQIGAAFEFYATDCGRYPSILEWLFGRETIEEDLSR